MENNENIGGLCRQMKNNTQEVIKKYSKEQLEGIFEDLFKNQNKNEGRMANLPLEWRHHEWEEDGEQYSCWTLIAGGLFHVLTTGDDGKEEFDNIMKEELNKLKNGE